MGKTAAVLEDCVHPPLAGYSLGLWDVLFDEPSLTGSPKHFFSLTNHP